MPQAIQAFPVQGERRFRVFPRTLGRPYETVQVRGNPPLPGNRIAEQLGVFADCRRWSRFHDQPLQVVHEPGQRPRTGSDIATTRRHVNPHCSQPGVLGTWHDRDRGSPVPMLLTEPGFRSFPNRQVQRHTGFTRDGAKKDTGKLVRRIVAKSKAETCRQVFRDHRGIQPAHVCLISRTTVPLSVHISATVRATFPTHRE